MRRQGHGTTPGVVELGVPLGILGVLAYSSLRERQFLLLDDAYIGFRYAANFAHGHGLVWNPGERVEGYTNLLWVLWLSGFARLGLDLTWPSVATSFLCAALTVAFTCRLARGRDDTGGVARWLPPLLLASNASFVHAATSGMESSAFGLLVLSGLVSIVRGRDSPRWRAAAAACFAVACLVRPEGALVAAVALGVEFCSSSEPVASRLSRLAPVAGIVALVVATHTAVRVAYYGYPFPNTFYAKVIFGPTTFARGVAHAAGFFVAGGFAALPGMAELRRPSPLRPLMMHGYWLLGAYVLYLLFIGGDHPHWYRFYVPLLPLPFLATGQLAGRIFSGRRGFENATPRRFAIASGLLALLPAAASHELAERREIIGRMSARDADVMAKVTSFFVREVPPGSFIAAAAVGHVGYYAASLHIVDMWGLNDVHIAHRNLPPSVKFGHDKFDLDYVAALKPDYAYILLPTPPPPIPGYDLCWPSRYVPVLVYRRNFALGETEFRLGLPPNERRALAPPPTCEPP